MPSEGLEPRSNLRLTTVILSWIEKKSCNHYSQNGSSNEDEEKHEEDDDHDAKMTATTTATATGVLKEAILQLLHSVVQDGYRGNSAGATARESTIRNLTGARRNGHRPRTREEGWLRVVIRLSQ